MTTVQMDIKPERFCIDFGSANGKKIFYDNSLGRFYNYDLLKIAGHKDPKISSSGVHAKRMRDGKYKISEFISICASLNIDPESILPKYEPKIVMDGITSSGIVIDNERIKKAVYDMICDGI